MKNYAISEKIAATVLVFLVFAALAYPSSYRVYRIAWGFYCWSVGAPRDGAEAFAFGMGAVVMIGLLVGVGVSLFSIWEGE